MCEEQQLFLQVRCEIEHAEDLTHPRPADPAQPGRYGIACDRARANQFFDMAGQRHQSRDLRDACRRGQIPPRLGVVRLHVFMLTESKYALDDQGGTHALSHEVNRVKVARACDRGT